MKSGDVGHPGKNRSVGNSMGSSNQSKNEVDKTVSLIRFPEPGLRLQTEGVGGGEGCSIFF